MVTNKLVEIFVPIIYEGIDTGYLISDAGRVMNSKTDKILKPRLDGSDYECVRLYFNNTSKEFKIHRLVGETFIPNPDNKPTINHKKPGKEGKALNTVDDLEWATHKEQTAHALKHNAIAYNHGTKHHMCTLTDKQFHDVCKLLVKGKSMKYISEKLNIPISTIDNIYYRKSWTKESSKYVFSDNVTKPNQKGENDTMAKLTDKQVWQVLELFDKGLSQSKIAKKFSVSRPCITNICNGRNRHDVYERYYNQIKEGSTTIENDEYYIIEIH